MLGIVFTRLELSVGHDGKLDFASCEQLEVERIVAVSQLTDSMPIINTKNITYTKEVMLMT